MKQEHQEYGAVDPSVPLMLAATFQDMTRPWVAGGQGKRSYGKPAFYAFIAMPIIAAAVHSPEIMIYWEAWTVMLMIRKIFYDRSVVTTYAGWPQAVSILTLGLLPEWMMRTLEPLLIYGVARLIEGWSVPLSRLLMFSAFCNAVTVSIFRERDKRRQEAIDDARKLAGG